MNSWGSPYPWLSLCGILVSTVLVGRISRGRPQFRDPRLNGIYLSGLIGSLLGAKLLFLLVEGPDLSSVNLHAWPDLLAGKSVLGGLLGGYLAVEIGKYRVGYRHATGDLFALIVPIGIILGRIGCLLHGCCLGRAGVPAWCAIRAWDGEMRWPAVPVEILFNALWVVFAVRAWRNGRFCNQLFHLYLVAYGVFRFWHEFLRDTPRGPWIINGYQIAALAVTALGSVQYVRRARNQSREG